MARFWASLIRGPGSFFGGVLPAGSSGAFVATGGATALGSATGAFAGVFETGFLAALG